MKEPLRFIIGLAIILSLAALDQWIFSTRLKMIYVDWYLKNGTLISLVFTIVSLSVGDLNKYTGLISPRPHIYLAAYMRLIGITLGAAAGTRKNQKGSEESERASYYLSQFEAPPPVLFQLLEVLIAVPIVFAMMALFVAYVIIVVPLQYFVFLICGAPVRAGVFRPTQRTIVNPFGYVRQLDDKDSQIPDGWWEVGFQNKPVALTNLIAALFLFFMRFFFS